MSNGSKAMQIEAGHSEVDPGFAGFGELFVITHQATALDQPGQRAFNDPAILL